MSHSLSRGYGHAPEVFSQAICPTFCSLVILVLQYSSLKSLLFANLLLFVSSFVFAFFVLFFPELFRTIPFRTIPFRHFFRLVFNLFSEFVLFILCFSLLFPSRHNSFFFSSAAIISLRFLFYVYCFSVLSNHSSFFFFFSPRVFLSLFFIIYFLFRLFEFSLLFFHSYFFLLLSFFFTIFIIFFLSAIFSLYFLSYLLPFLDSFVFAAILFYVLFHYFSFLQIPPCYSFIHFSFRF